MIKIPFKAVIVLISFFVLVSCGGGGGGGAADDSSFTIGYNANGAESGSVPSSQNGNGKTALVVSYNTGNLAKSGYLFDGWNTQPDGYGIDYVPGVSYTGNKNITLYAKWARLFDYEPNLVSPTPDLNDTQRVSSNPTATIIGLTARGRQLAEVTIPRTIDGYIIVAIGDGAFQGCTNVANMLIPDTITDIGNNAFNGCSNLSLVTMQGTTPPTLGTDAFTGCVLLVVSVPQSAAGAYNSSPEWSTVAILAPGTFSIIYNGNGSDGGIIPARQVGMIGISINIYDNNGSLTRAGCTFNGWNTKADGSGHSYSANAPYAGPDNMILYAQWTHPDYIVTFDDQGADIQHVFPSTIVVKAPANTISSLPSIQPQKDGYYFSCWNTLSDGTGESFTVGAQVINSMTVYAKWIENNCTIKYDGNGATSGSVPQSHDTQFNQSIILRSNTGNLRKTGYEFGGWNTKADGSGIDYAPGADYLVQGNITLYAKWWMPVYSSISGNRDGANIGDIVLADGKTVSAQYYENNYIGLTIIDGVVIGIVAYEENGIKNIVQIDYDNTKRTWTIADASGFNKELSTTNSGYTNTYSIIKELDDSGVNGNYPVFEYAWNYHAPGINQGNNYYSNWFIPSNNELSLLVNNWNKINNSIQVVSNIGGNVIKLPNFGDDVFIWSSSQNPWSYGVIYSYNRYEKAKGYNKRQTPDGYTLTLSQLKIKEGNVVVVRALD